jgi:hypothetical protein
MERLVVLLADISCDICVLTETIEAGPFGPFDAALSAWRVCRRHLRAVLGSWEIMTPSE